MPVIRCPQCHTQVTEDELRTGTCLMCDAALPALAPTPASRPIPQAAAPHQSSFVYSLLLVVIGVLAFCLFPVGIMLYNMLPEKTPSKDDPVLAQKPVPKKDPKVKPDPVVDSKLDDSSGKPKSNGPDAEKPIKVEESKKVDAKKEEPKKIEAPKDVAKKPDEPKKVDEPKKPDPLPPVGPPHLANAYLPLLADDVIRIDGDLADWKDINAVFLIGIERGRSTKKAVAFPKTQKVYLAYCSKGILVAVDVVDTSGALENAGKPARGMWPFWDNDAVEIYIDTLNRRPQRRGDASLHQFFAFPFGTPGDTGIGGYESRILRNAAGREDWTIVAHSSVGPSAMVRAGKKTATGWTMELLIPRSALRQGDLKPGQILGFELQIDTGTNVYYFWANDNPDVRVSMNPGGWGEIGLAGTDAKVEILDAENKPAKIVMPGKPLTVRVTDADMNLDSAHKERINVTLLSKTGDRKTLLLEETLPNSGVFVGSMPTRLSVGKREEKTLEVLAGDVIVVEYLDQIRGNSTRNVLLRSEVVTPPK